MRTYFEQIPLRAVRRVLANGGARNVVQMPALAVGIAARVEGNVGRTGFALPSRVVKCQPDAVVEPAKPAAGCERWRQLAEAASREQDTRTLLKLVEDLVRELPETDQVRGKNAHVGTE